MQVAPINQNNQNFKAAHMSRISADEIGFSKRGLLKEFPVLKEVAENKSLLITSSPESYKLTRLLTDRTEKAICNFFGAMASLLSGLCGAVAAPEVGYFSCLLGVVAFCYFAYSLAMNIVQTKETVTCKKIVIQAGEGYENGELQGKKSAEITTNYVALKNLPITKLLQFSTNPGKETFEPETKAQNLYEWHIEPEESKVRNYYNTNKNNNNDNSPSGYYFNGITWVKVNTLNKPFRN